MSGMKPALVEPIYDDDPITQPSLLSQAEARYRALVENVPYGIYISQYERIVYVNPEFVRLLGARHAQDLIGRLIWDHIHPSCHEGVRQRRQQVLEKGEAAPISEEVFIRKDGSLLDVEVNGSPCLHRGSPAILVMVRDLSEFKHAQAALRESEAKFRTLVEQMPAITYVTALDNAKTVYVSPQIREILGYEPADWLEDPHSFPRAIHPDDRDRVLADMRRSQEQGTPFEAEYRLLRSDGEAIWVRDKATTVVDAQGHAQYVQGLALDITKHKQAEEVLQNYSERLRILSQQILYAQENERRAIARELHDEIGQTLTAIQISLHRALQAKNTRLALAPLENAITAVDQVLQQVRTLSLNLRPSILDDLGLAAALEWYLERLGAHAKQPIEVIAEPLEPRPTAEIEIVLFRVAQEAITNIVRHAQAKRAKVLLRQRENTLELVIEDDGLGFNVAQTLSRYQSLGLAGMQDRMLMLGGALNIDSKPGQGTVIRAVVPLSAGWEFRTASIPKSNHAQA